MNYFCIFFISFILIIQANFVFSGEILLDEFNDSSLGNTYGITYTDTPNGRGAVFQRSKESRIQYEFLTQIPKEGTLEFYIKVDSGYWYSNSTLYENQQSALIFTTDIQLGDVIWPGSTWIHVFNDGKIYFRIALEKYESYNIDNILVAQNTEAKYGEWLAIGFSYGSEGQYIMLNGNLVASNQERTIELGLGGNHSTPNDIPTIGESVSSVWSNNQNEGGFEGIIDTFRVSDSQKDWKISLNNNDCTCEGYYSQEEVDRLINNILDWDKNKDGKLGLIEAIHLIKESAGMINK
jgi:hypothetical protein